MLCSSCNMFFHYILHIVLFILCSIYSVMIAYVFGWIERKPVPCVVLTLLIIQYGEMGVLLLLFNSIKNVRFINAQVNNVWFVWLNKLLESIFKHSWTCWSRFIWFISFLTIINIFLYTHSHMHQCKTMHKIMLICNVFLQFCVLFKMISALLK